MYMKVLSFDVGIKNLAYCLFTKPDTKWAISDWKVVSLLGDEPVQHRCCATNPPKNKKTPENQNQNKSGLNKGNPKIMSSNNSPKLS